MSGEFEGEKVLLLEKGKRGIQRVIFGRTLIILALVMFQALLLIGTFNYFGNYIKYAISFYMVFAIIIVFVVINRPKNPDINLSWVILILVAPIVGSMLYLFVESQIGNRMINARLQKIIKETGHYVKQDEKTYADLKQKDAGLAGLAQYMSKYGSFTVSYGNEVQYFPAGEDKFQDLLAEIKKAEKYIFIEYFIIKEGIMWGNILKLLEEKAQKGVEIRVMYDGMCCLAQLPVFYPKEIRKLGIKCKMFEPIQPVLSTHYNNRDHRKIFIIDGKIAYTGGINLADEYINKTHPFGHWKDTAVKITGEGVKNFTLMFLQMWNMKPDRGKMGKVIEENYKRYIDVVMPYYKNYNGFVIPYSDSPLDNELVGEMVYMHIINRAKKYVYFMTPYLIPDHDMMTSITYAAKRNIDVRIILPGIPDKKYAYALAQNQYKELISAGVKIYEYVPGFVHGKVCVSDDDIAVVGTINLDYRSLYLNFECGLLMYDVKEIENIKKDIFKTIEVSELQNMKNYKKGKRGLRLMGKLLKPFAPLM